MSNAVHPHVTRPPPHVTTSCHCGRHLMSFQSPPHVISRSTLCRFSVNHFSTLCRSRSTRSGHLRSAWSCGLGVAVPLRTLGRCAFALPLGPPLLRLLETSHLIGGRHGGPRADFREFFAKFGRPFQSQNFSEIWAARRRNCRRNDFREILRFEAAQLTGS